MAAAIPSSQPRRKRRLFSAASAGAAALFFLSSCPLSAHAVDEEGRGGGGLRGGGRGANIPQQQQPLSHDEEEQQRTLTSSSAVVGDIKTIHPFQINLLSTHFPYRLKYTQDNEISSAVGGYLAPYLTATLESNVDALGMDCTRYQQSLGAETRWVLGCEGHVTFDNEENEGQVMSAVYNAFTYPAMNNFLEIMYANYEIVHEMQEYDARFSSLRTTRGGRPSSRNKKKHRGKKKQNNGKLWSQNGKKKNNGKKNNRKKDQMKKGKKPRDKPQQMMSSASGGGNKNNNGFNVMGYVSGSQTMQQNSGGKNVDKKGNIVVYLSP